MITSEKITYHFFKGCLSLSLFPPQNEGMIIDCVPSIVISRQLLLAKRLMGWWREIIFPSEEFLNNERLEKITRGNFILWFPNPAVHQIPGGSFLKMLIFRPHPQRF